MKELKEAFLEEKFYRNHRRFSVDESSEVFLWEYSDKLLQEHFFFLRIFRKNSLKDFSEKFLEGSSEKFMEDGMR